MSKSNYQITIDRTGGDGKANEVILVPAGKTAPVRLQAQPGAIYTLTDRATDKAPQQIHARRQGRNLLLQFDERVSGEVDLILENFYEGVPGTFIGLAEDGSTYRFIPNTARESDQFASLPDGAQASQVLGGAAYTAADASAGAPVGVAAAGLVPVAGLGLGTGGLVVAGLAGAAALAGGGGGGAGGGSSPGASFKAGLLSGEDTGTNPTDNITNKAQPQFGGTVAPGSKVLVKVDNQPEQGATVDALGNWSWTPTTPLAEGQHKITFTQVDGNNIRGTSTDLTLIVDTGKLKAGYTSNFTQLNTEPVPLDAKLNTKESENGILVTLTFDEAPERDLNRDDLILSTGDSILNFNKVPNLNKYELLIQPKADSSGQMLLKWSDKGKALRDVAGNPLDDLNLQWKQDYDTQAPDVSLFSGQEEVTYKGGEGDLNIAWVANTGTTDLASISLTLLGQTVQKTTNLGTTALKSTGGLNDFKEGYYSLSTTFADAAGNTAVFDTLLIIDRKNLRDDAWDPSKGNAQVGTADVDLFINLPGDQTITGGPSRDTGGGDIYVWLAYEAGGTAGKPDTDTITDFLLGSTGQSDRIDIKDLLGLGSSTVPVNAANLSRFVQVSSVDSDNNSSVDSTRVSISRDGAFTGPANVSSVADQVIILKGAVANSLNDLLPNLDWQATGGVLLA